MKAKSRAAQSGPRYKGGKLKSFDADKLSRALLYTSSSIIIGLDKEANIVIFNKGAEEATGWKAKEVVGKNWIDNFIYKKERPNVWGIFQKVVALDMDMGHVENRIITKSGSHMHVRWHNTVITDGGQFVMTLSMGDDITKLRHAQIRLIRQNKKLLELSQMREKFLADITHELKTPLSVIILNLDLLRRTCSTFKRGKAKNSLDLMWRNALRLSHSIETIMDLTKMDSVDIQSTNFSLKETVNSVVENFLPIAESKPIKLLVHGPNLRVRGDPHILSMALGNLISNALKFTDKGEVSISWKRDKGNVVISVSDTGRGILKENQPKVFEKFFKEKHDAPGSGIGLNVSKSLVERMGGIMGFRSTPGKGSTFTITIPKEAKK